jgi:hypothetical protein
VLAREGGGTMSAGALCRRIAKGRRFNLRPCKQLAMPAAGACDRPLLAQRGEEERKVSNILLAAAARNQSQLQLANAHH